MQDSPTSVRSLMSEFNWLKKQRLHILDWKEQVQYQNQIKKCRFGKGVYVILSGETILYIGSSDSVGLRISGHERTAQAYRENRRDVKVFYALMENHKSEEIRLIKKYSPIYNIHHNALKFQPTI